MKAFFLAAGLGTRLRPITYNIPKCLVEIAGKPLLGWWLELMELHGITEVLINIHNFAKQIKTYIQSSNTSIKFRFFYEEKLLGSGGTLRENRSFVNNEKDFYILYADNLTNYNLTEFLKFHRSNNSYFSMALFKSNTPQNCGVALKDINNTIISFEEKPKNPKSNLANAGIYIANPKVIDLIPYDENIDIGYHILPKLVGKMKGWKSDDYLIDIGTPQNLKKANKEWLKIIKR